MKRFALFALAWTASAGFAAAQDWTSGIPSVCIAHCDIPLSTDSAYSGSYDSGGTPAFIYWLERIAENRQRVREERAAAFNAGVEAAAAQARAGNIDEFNRLATELDPRTDELRDEVESWVRFINYRHYVQRGGEALNADDYAAAAAHYRRALPLLAEREDRLRLEGFLAELDAAIAERAVRARLAALGDQRDAEAVVRNREAQATALRLDGEGISLLNAGRYEEAAARFAEANDANEGMSAIMAHWRRAGAEVWIARGNLSQAMQLLRQAPDDPEAVARLAELETSQARQTEALRRALQETERRLEGVLTDTSVVDARGSRPQTLSNLPRLEEVENSPGAEAWRRGMDAVVQSDWELASAMFATALQRDPTNAALQRAVDLAEWTKNYRRDRQVAMATAQTALERDLRTPRSSDLEPLFEQATTDQTEAALRRSQDSDLKYMFAPGAVPDAPPSLEETIALNSQEWDFERQYLRLPVQPTNDDLRQFIRRAEAREMVLTARLRRARGEVPERYMPFLDLAIERAPEIREYADFRDGLREQAARAATTGLAPTGALDFLR